MEGRKETKKQLKTAGIEGSFTVEATLIFGFAAACLIFCIYSCLYLHDKAVLEGAASLAAQKGRLYITENQKLYTGESDWESVSGKGLLWRITGYQKNQEIAEYAAFLTDGKLLVCQTPSFQVSSGSDRTEVSYRAKTVLKGFYPLGDILVIPEIKGTAADRGMEAEEFVRLVKALTEGR